MASKADAAKPRSSKPVYSIPVFERELEIQSLQAQRVMNRVFKRTVRALYSIDTILRIIGDDQEMDEVEEIIAKMFTDAQKALEEESSRLDTLMENNGISEVPEYTNPHTYQVKITSPQAAVYANLVSGLDALMVKMDACWLLSVLDNKQRKEGTFQWQQRILRLGRRIVDIEVRARKAATRKGKEDEVKEALPPEPEDSDNLDDVEAEAEKKAPKKKAPVKKKAAAKKTAAA